MWYLYIFSTVPAASSEVLRVTSTGLEEELRLSQSLAQKYTAVLEKLTDPDGQCEECDVPILRLKQALYNVRQHEAFLSVLLVRSQSLLMLMVSANVDFLHLLLLACEIIHNPNLTAY